MLNKLKAVLGVKYFPLNEIKISKKNLVSNYKYLCSLGRQIKIAPVLKSNAYGHGIVEVAKILDKVNAPMFCVDSLYEAYELLKAKIKTPILIMGYINPENLKVKRLPFSYAVYDLKLLEAIDKYQIGAEVHIKVDTGMHRLGVPTDQLKDFTKEVLKFKNIKIVGLLSHFASADDPRDTLNKVQIENFKKAHRIVKSLGINLRWNHLANSDGLINLGSKLSEITNIARTGLALYGISSDKNLKPVLELTSQVVQIKELKQGDRVGYSGAYKASKNMLLGILPIGYNDGIDRRLSRIGSFIVKEQNCPIIGRVSMNITAIDITSVKNPKVGDKVIIFSKKPKDINSIENCAKICKTIPYELLIHLSPTSIRREVI